MKLTTPTGIEIDVEVSGFREAPKITMEPQRLNGVRIGGEGQIAASVPKGPIDSLYFKPAYFRVDLGEVREAIGKLPHKVYMARKVKHSDVMDGCTVYLWDIEGDKTTPAGRWLDDTELGDFLDIQRITEIETAKAVQMWSEHYETPEKLAAREAENREMRALQQQWADEEEMEA